MTSVLETRPVSHQTDARIRGHVCCAFLALVLRHELERRLAATRWSLEWADIVHDLDGLHETTLTIDGHASIVRSETKGTVGKIVQACGVAILPALRPAHPSESAPTTADRRVTTPNRRPSVLVPSGLHF